MDIYEYLKLDHKKVAKLFDLYESATTEKNKLEIFELINKELLVHSDSESTTFCKALEAHQKSEDEALHGEEEHAEIKNKLSQISKLHLANSAMVKQIEKLKELVEHHVSDEEGKIFRAAKKVFTNEEACILKEKMHDYKEKLLNEERITEKQWLN